MATFHSGREWDFTKPEVTKAMQEDARSVMSNIEFAWGLTNVRVDFYMGSGTMKAIGAYPDGTIAVFAGYWDGQAWSYSQLKMEMEDTK